MTSFSFASTDARSLIAFLKDGMPPQWVRSPQCRTTSMAGRGFCRGWWERLGSLMSKLCVSDRIRKRVEMVDEIEADIVNSKSICLVLNDDQDMNVSKE